MPGHVWCAWQRYVHGHGLPAGGAPAASLTLAGGNQQPAFSAFWSKAMLMTDDGDFAVAADSIQ
ncbi:hypothetical protein [Thiothrix lacustris]|uniref:hypothetical protein n=1 Tax=Thiothrix lacustris TaxID=525917 RepID=UPI0027E41900|nr:hypothetical protein [Thiothrix lacustris]WMP17491.1 hypothetical protein RCS87_19240 [Thiothrix lacustris]